MPDETLEAPPPVQVPVAASRRGPGVHPHPLVNIYPVSGLGWKAFPSHLRAASAHRCGGLKLVYR